MAAAARVVRWLCKRLCEFDTQDTTVCQEMNSIDGRLPVLAQCRLQGRLHRTSTGRPGPGTTATSMTVSTPQTPGYLILHPSTIQR